MTVIIYLQLHSVIIKLEKIIISKYNSFFFFVDGDIYDEDTKLFH